MPEETAAVRSARRKVEEESVVTGATIVSGVAALVVMVNGTVTMKAVSAEEAEAILSS